MTTVLWLIAVFVVGYVAIYLGMERAERNRSLPRQRTKDVIPAQVNAWRNRK